MPARRDQDAPHILTPAECAELASAIALDDGERTADRLKALALLHTWGNGGEVGEDFKIRLEPFTEGAFDPLAADAISAL